VAVEGGLAEMIPQMVFSCGREAQYLDQEPSISLGVFPECLLQFSLLGKPG
jgi:hypothetical protein